MENILVIGSYNVGLSVFGPKIPQIGETVMGDHFDMGPGGKGSNQAIAAARLGGKVTFMAKVGSDIFGREALKLFKKEHLGTDYIKIEPNTATGAGIIFIDKDGHNSIGVAPGANYKLTKQEIDDAAALFKTHTFLLIQLEIPLEVVYHAIKKAKENQVTVVLNPAPAQKIDKEYLPMIDILTPNETEAEVITGQKVKDPASAIRAAKMLVAQGVETVIVTLGGQGSVLVSKTAEKHFAAPNVRAVDTAGAGDAFNGGLVYALAKGMTLEKAIEFGSKVGAILVTHIGCVPGLPTLKEVEQVFEKGERP